MQFDMKLEYVGCGKCSERQYRELRINLVSKRIDEFLRLLEHENYVTNNVLCFSVWIDINLADKGSVS